MYGKMPNGTTTAVHIILSYYHTTILSYYHTRTRNALPHRHNRFRRPARRAAWPTFSVRDSSRQIEISLHEGKGKGGSLAQKIPETPQNGPQKRPPYLTFGLLSTLNNLVSPCSNTSTAVRAVRVSNNFYRCSSCCSESKSTARTLTHRVLCSFAWSMLLQSSVLFVDWALSIFPSGASKGLS